MKNYYLVYDASGVEWVRVGQVTNVKEVKRLVKGLSSWVVGYMQEDKTTGKIEKVTAASSTSKYTIYPNTQVEYPTVYDAYRLQQRIKKAGTK